MVVKISGLRKIKNSIFTKNIFFIHEIIISEMKYVEQHPRYPSYKKKKNSLNWDDYSTKNNKERLEGVEREWEGTSSSSLSSLWPWGFPESKFDSWCNDAEYKRWFTRDLGLPHIEFATTTGRVPAHFQRLFALY